MHSDLEKKLAETRTKFLGLEEKSSVKSYYPQLREKIIELEKNETFLRDKSKALLNILEDLEVEKKRTKESERKLSESLKVAKVGYWEYDILSDKFIFNDQYYSLHKTTAKEIGGYEITSKFFAENLVYPEESQQVEKAIFEAINTNDVNFEYQTEARIMTIDKKPIWVIVWFKIIKDLNGKTIRLLGVSQDINLRKLAEERLKQSEENYRRFFEEDLSGVFLSTPEKGLKTCNRAYVKMMEYDSIDELINSDPVSHYQQSQDRIDFLNLLRKEKKLTNYEGKIVTKTGKTRQTIENIIGVFDEKDNLVEFWGYVNDITARKKAELVLKNAAAEKEALHRELLHRVKNSFALIKSLIYLERQRLDNEETNKVLEELEHRVGSLSQMYSLLNETGVSQQIDLDYYLNQITQSLVNSFIEKEQKISFKTSFDKISVNPKEASSIGLIVNELLTNSLKYAFNNETEGVIDISLKVDDSKATLFVSDSGKGLPESFSIENSSGMGLELVKMLTDQLSGTLEFESKAGTTFKITIPIRD